MFSKKYFDTMTKYRLDNIRNQVGYEIARKVHEYQEVTGDRGSGFFGFLNYMGLGNIFHWINWLPNIGLGIIIILILFLMYHCGWFKSCRKKNGGNDIRINVRDGHSFDYDSDTL